MAMATASGLNGNIPDFKKPALTLLMENARSNGPLKTRAKSRLDTTKFGFEKAKACRLAEVVLQRLKHSNVQGLESMGCVWRQAK